MSNSIQIPGDAICKIVEAHVQAAVAEALDKDGTKLVQELGHALKQVILEQAKLAMKEWMDERAPMVKAEFLAQLRQSGAAKMFDGLANAICSANWGVRMEVLPSDRY